MNEQQECKRCGFIKPIADYTSSRGTIYPVCKPCQKEQKENYHKGINADIETMAPNSRWDIECGRELLEKMGYDLNYPIHDQFKNRMKVLYGVDMDAMKKPRRRQKKEGL